LSGLLFFLISCSNDFAPQESIDTELSDLLIKHGGDLAFYTLPDSDDFSAIPQDPKNPLTKDKVALGKLLYHETALAVDSKFPSSMNTYSCASCHHAQAGFQANLPQGIGDGGIGFGFMGEMRRLDPLSTASDIDVQPIRTPTTLNVQV